MEDIEAKSLIVAFVLSVLVGLVAYLIATVVPYLQPHKETVGLGVFAIAFLLFLL